MNNFFLYVEGKQSPLSEDEIGNLIRNQLTNLALEESRLKWMQDVLDQQSSEFPIDKLDRESGTTHPIFEQEIEFEELLHEENEIIAMQGDLHDDLDGAFSIGKPVEDPFSKLRLSTLATLEEKRSTDSPEASIWKDSDCFSSVDAAPEVVDSCGNAQVVEVNSSQSNSLLDSTQEESTKLIDILSAIKMASIDHPEMPAPVAKDFITDGVTESFKSVAISSENVFTEEGHYHKGIIIQSKDYTLDENISPRLQNIDTGHLEGSTKEMFKTSEDNPTLKYAIKDDLIQSVSPDFDSKDSVNSSGAFLLSSNASSMLDCPDINGLSEKKYFDLNDTSILRSESETSDFLSSLEIKKESEENKSYKKNLENCHREGSQEEFLPTLDFLNADLTEITPMFPLGLDSAKKEVNHVDVLPLALEEGNKRPSTTKFKVPYGEEDAVDNELDLKLSENASMKPLLSLDSSKENILSSAHSENFNLIYLMQTTNIDLKSSSETLSSAKNHLGEQELERNEKTNEFSSENNYLLEDSKMKGEVAKDFNKDIQNSEIFSEDACDLSTIKFSGTFENVIGDCGSSTKEYVLNTSKTSSYSIEAETSLPIETISTQNVDDNCVEAGKNDFSIVSANSNIKETISSTGSLQENSVVPENTEHSEKSSARVSNGDFTKDTKTVFSIVESNDFNTVPLCKIDGKTIDPIVKELDSLNNDESGLEHQTIPKNETLKEDVRDLKEDSEFSKVADDFRLAKHHSSEESALDTLTETTAAKSKASEKTNDALPQIIVSPASESEMEDELEEYLRNQLKFAHDPEPTLEEDFSVTSQYTVRPFEDVFGTQNVPSGASRDYIEAYNFEIDGGDFFEDFSNDEEKLSEGWESACVASTTEIAPAESTERQESSPLCFVSKDSAHL